MERHITKVTSLMPTVDAPNVLVGSVSPAPEGVVGAVVDSVDEEDDEAELVVVEEAVEESDCVKTTVDEGVSVEMIVVNWGDTGENEVDCCEIEDVIIEEVNGTVD